jgi:hypothetical protein
MMDVTRKEISCTRDWEDETFTTYLGYYIASGLAITDGEGYCIGRPVKEVSTGVKDRYAIDWDGHCMWVESVAGCKCKMGKAIRYSLSLLKTYGCDIRLIAWNRTHLDRPEPVIMEINRILRFV